MAGRNNKYYPNKIKFILGCWMSGGLLLVNNGLLAASAKSLNSDYTTSQIASKKFIIAKPPDERQPEAVQQGIEKIPTSETPIQRKPSQPIEPPLPPTISPEPTPTEQPSPTSTPSGSETTPTIQPSPTQPTVNPTPQPQPDVTPTTTPTPSLPQSQPDVTPTTTPRQTAPQPQRRQPTPQPTQSAPQPQRRQPTPQPNVTPTTPRQTAPQPQRRQSTPQPNVTPTTPRQTAPQPQRRQSTPQPNVTPTTPRQRQSAPIPRPVESNPTNQQVNPTSTTKPSGRTIPQRQRNQQRNTKSPLPSPSNYRNINFVDVEIGVLARGDFQSRGRYFHFYQFEGTENQLIEIRLTGSIDKRRSNNLSLDPFMFLLDSNNRVILTRSSNEITSGQVKSAFAFVRLPATGRYTIAVTSRNPGDSGRYSLALRNDRASYALDKSGVLSKQSSTMRKNGNAYSVSQFQGRRDQLVSIRADSIYEDFSPYIVLLNSRGEVVARDNDKDGRYTALIDRVRLPQDDTYYVVVLSAIPREKGTYRLTVF